jgi:hypothetical protein
MAFQIFEISGDYEPSEHIRRTGSLPPAMTPRRDRSIFDDIDLGSRVTNYS